MVEGLNRFTEHFKEHTGQYILIGGNACDTHFTKIGMPFRVTTDLDIILIVEALSTNFVNHFWQFVKDGEYTLSQKGQKLQFYRFKGPKTKGFPETIELFSRVPDTIKEIEGMHLTDIPTEDEASSLSAILLDENYYQFALANTTITDGLHHANDIALIVLKAKAFLNNKKRKDEGQDVRTVDIVKHKNDVIRLVYTMNPNTVIDIPSPIKEDLLAYISTVRDERPDVDQVLKGYGAKGITFDQISDQLVNSFQLS